MLDICYNKEELWKCAYNINWIEVSIPVCDAQLPDIMRMAFQVTLTNSERSHRTTLCTIMANW